MPFRSLDRPISNAPRPRVPFFIALFALIISLPVTPARAADAEVAHPFVYTPPAGTMPKTVHIAGDFNGWSKDATPMKRGADGAYVARVKLTHGTYLYKFVIDGEQWINDPLADVSLEADDGHGGKNSGVVIGKDIRKAPPAQPNAINTDFVLHDPDDPQDAVANGAGILVRVRTQAGDVQRVTAVVHGKGVLLERTGVEPGLDFYSAFITARGQPHYYFLLEDGDAKALLNAKGAFVGPAAIAAEKDNGDFTVRPQTVDVPDWAKHAVWYQIFPERFRNGDTSNDPDGSHRWQSKWFATLPGEAPGKENFYKGQGNVWKRRYGGDIQGVREALPYLRKLGVNALYFNPIFEGESMHKYDATDFRHVDDNFGVKGDLAQLQGETDDPATWKWTKSDLVFLDFVQEARRQGFKVIIDGVFNHVGTAHPFFQDVLKNGKHSKYADWFEVTDWNHPIQYKAWDKPSGELPVFKKNAARGLAPGPYAHIMAITKRWLAPDGDVSRGVDGFRLDVPGDIPHPFWIEWRKLVKSTNPDAYITGEVWQWAQPWLKGDQFDAVMNYQFAMASQDFFIDVKEAIRPSDFAAQLTRIAYAYPWQVALAQQNLFDSHDTDRLASMFVNPDRPYDGHNRIQDNGPDYKPDMPSPEHWRRMAQAVAFQMAYVGAPMIYYGDETGMWSPDDPSNRQPMVWQDLAPYDDEQVRFNEQVFETYRRAIAVRHALEPLRTGTFRTLLADDEAGVVAFARESPEGRVSIVINRSERAQRVEVPLGNGPSSAALLNWLDPAHVELVAGGSASDVRPTLRVKRGAQPISAKATATISLPPYGTAVLAPVPAVQSN